MSKPTPKTTTPRAPRTPRVTAATRAEEFAEEPARVPMKSYVFRTLISNWRDIFMFLLVGVGLAVARIYVDSQAALYTGSKLGLILGEVALYLQGFSRFAAVSFCASIPWMLVWPNVNEVGHNDSMFMKGWESLGVKGQFLLYVGLIAVALIAAAICFSVPPPSI